MGKHEAEKGSGTGFLDLVGYPYGLKIQNFKFSKVTVTFFKNNGYFFRFYSGRDDGTDSSRVI